MRIDGRDYRTIWWNGSAEAVEVIDQRILPHRFETVLLRAAGEAAEAIRDMTVRGAPLIGAAGAYALALAMREDASDAGLESAAVRIGAARPTAVNLRWAVERVQARLARLAPSGRAEAALAEAAAIADEDAAMCEAIGRHGVELIESARRAGKDRIDVLTHCNAGWLATVDWGTALAPVYAAHRAGLPVHVWVDETRPRNQGAALTAWELGQEGVPHTVVADNAGGHLMQHGQVDLVIVGSDRTTRTGDVCNKIGTYLKALAAHDNGVPFYAALPSSTIDWRIRDGVAEIPIEERSGREVTHIAGLGEDGRLHTVRLTPEGAHAANPAFDVTPARLVSAIITERGVCAAREADLRALFADSAEAA
jgi:methylthioribose-1-phosphate isomerase